MTSKRMLLGSVLLGVSLLYAEPAKPVGRVTTAHATADEQAILKTDRDFAREAQTRKQDAWADFAEPNITLAAPDVKGREAFRAHWAKAYSDPTFKLTWEPDYARVFGDIGVTSGKYRAESKGKASTGRYVTVWQRQADNSWKFAWDNGTSDKAAASK
jgi:ketosteroid isomerase-like protein